MNREIIITRLPVGSCRPLVYVRIEDGQPVQFELESPEGEERTGNIYVGKIEKLSPALQAAFVRITSGQSGYLPLAKAKKALVRTPRPDGKLRDQDELLVQIEREAIKGKLPSLKTTLEFPGSLLVLLTDNTGIFFSPRLAAEEKKQTGEWIRELQAGRGYSFGVLVRTNAASASREELGQEFERLYQEAYRICRYGLSRSVYSCLRKTGSFWMELLKGLPRQEPVRILTDEPEIYEELGQTLSAHKMPEVSPELYREVLQPLYKKYALDDLMHNLLERRVPLPSGGFLVIEQTEAFVAVDVNSGRRKGDKVPENFYYHVNMEAAKEIARQLRLRNLSGTVLIDFINMKDRTLIGRLSRELQREFQKDPVRTQVIDVTQLNITEVSRQKVRKALWEQAEQYREAEKESDEWQSRAGFAYGESAETL